MASNATSFIFVVTSLFVFVYLLWELYRERKRIIASEPTRNCVPNGKVERTLNLLSFGVQNHKTVSDMLHWKSEVDNIDGILSDVTGNPCG